MAPTRKSCHFSSSLLTEVQLDIFRCLDRFDLDAVQFSSPQLRDFVEVFARHLPIRNIDTAVVRLRERDWLKNTKVVASNGRELSLPTENSTIEDTMCFVMKAIQGAYVRVLGMFDF